MPTRADIIAARESIEMIPKQADFFGNSEAQMHADAMYEYLQGPYSTQEYWRDLASKELGGLQGAELEAAKKAFVEKYSKQITDRISQYGETSQQAAEGGLMDRYSGIAGGLGAAMGALVGGVFGGKGGALIGGLLGGIGLYAIQKLGLLPESWNTFFKSGVDNLLGPAANPLDKEQMFKSVTSGVDAAIKQEQESVAEVERMNREEWGETTTPEGVMDMNRRGLRGDVEMIKQSAIDQGLGPITDQQAQEIAKMTAETGFTPEAVGAYLEEQSPLLKAQEVSAGVQTTPQETLGQVAEGVGAATGLPESKAADVAIQRAGGADVVAASGSNRLAAEEEAYNAAEDARLAKEQERLNVARKIYGDKAVIPEDTAGRYKMFSTMPEAYKKNWLSAMQNQKATQKSLADAQESLKMMQANPTGFTPEDIAKTQATVARFQNTLNEQNAVLKNYTDQANAMNELYGNVRTSHLGTRKSELEKMTKQREAAGQRLRNAEKAWRSTLYNPNSRLRRTAEKAYEAAKAEWAPWDSPNIGKGSIAIYSPNEKAKAWGDLKKDVETIGKATPVWQPPKLED